jgi:hypothetical protein
MNSVEYERLLIADLSPGERRGAQIALARKLALRLRAGPLKADNQERDRVLAFTIELLVDLAEELTEERALAARRDAETLGIGGL